MMPIVCVRTKASNFVATPLLSALGTNMKLVLGAWLAFCGVAEG